MGGGPEETFSPRRRAGGPQGHGKVLSVTDHWESGIHTETTVSWPLAPAGTAVIEKTRDGKW